MAAFGASQNLPATAEFDLIFPRNETYAPTAYFPLVFAIQNAKVAWPLRLRLQASIQAADGDIGPNNWHLPSFDANSDYTDGSAPSDPYIWVVGTNITNSTEGRFRVLWSPSIERNCSRVVNGNDPPNAGFFPPPLELWFTTAKGAAVPDITGAVDACPEQNYTLGVADILNQQSKPCPALNSTTPPANPCGLKPFAKDIEGNVSAALLSLSGCKSSPWQNITSPCPKSGSSSLGQGSVWATLAMSSLLMSFLL